MVFFFLASFLTLFLKTVVFHVCLYDYEFNIVCVHARLPPASYFQSLDHVETRWKIPSVKINPDCRDLMSPLRGGDVAGAATCAPAFCHRTGASACRSELRRRPTWPAGWRRTRRRPATGCPPGGSGPWPRRPAGPPGTGGSSPSSGAPGPSAPGTVNRNRTRCLKSDTCCRPRPLHTPPPHPDSRHRPLDLVLIREGNVHPGLSAAFRSNVRTVDGHLKEDHLLGQLAVAVVEAQPVVAVLGGVHSWGRTEEMVLWKGARKHVSSSRTVTFTLES